MSLEFYKVLHIAGLVMVALGFGALLWTPKDAERPRMGVMLHGIGMLVMLVAGFGTLAKLHVDVATAWVLFKLMIWLTLGALPALVRTGTVPRKLGWITVVALAAAAAWLAIAKPSFG